MATIRLRQRPRPPAIADRIAAVAGLADRIERRPLHQLNMPQQSQRLMMGEGDLAQAREQWANTAIIVLLCPNMWQISLF